MARGNCFAVTYFLGRSDLSYNMDIREHALRIISEWSLDNDPNVLYSIFGIENAGGKSSWHIQGYIVFAKQCGLATLRRRCCNAHIENAYERFEHNIRYCSKEGRVFSVIGAKNRDAASGVSAVELAERLVNKTLRAKRSIRTSSGTVNISRPPRENL